MPYLPQVATARPTIHPVDRNDDLTPKGTQKSKTTVGIAISGVSTHPLDRENATDTARAEGLGLRYRTSPGETQGARATPATRPDPGDGADGDRGETQLRPSATPIRSDIMKSWYTIRARDTGAEVLIYDEIGAYGVSAKGFLAELGALPDDRAIDLRLNSPGGSVFDAVAIYNALSRHAGMVTVWIDGIAASAASYVAMAGDEIVMPENAFLMIHDPSALVMGTAADMRDMAGTLDKIASSMLRGYASRSGKPEEEIAALLAAETWFDAAEALEAGLATRLAEPVRIAAAFDISQFRNAPPALIEAVEAVEPEDDATATDTVEDDTDGAPAAPDPAPPSVSENADDTVAVADTVPDPTAIRSEACRAASLLLIPSTRHARRTRSYSSTDYLSRTQFFRLGIKTRTFTPRRSDHPIVSTDHFVSGIHKNEALYVAIDTRQDDDLTAEVRGAPAHLPTKSGGLQHVFFRALRSRRFRLATRMATLSPPL